MWTWRVRGCNAFDDGFVFSDMVMGKVKALSGLAGVGFLASVLLLYELFTFSMLRFSVFFIGSRIGMNSVCLFVS